MRVTEPVVLIIDCPVESLFTGPTLLVMGIEGVVSGEALLISTTLTCADVGDVKILNGRVCQTTTTQNQTTGVCTSVYKVQLLLCLIFICNFSYRFI